MYNDFIEEHSLSDRSLYHWLEDKDEGLLEYPIHVASIDLTNRQYTKTTFPATGMKGGII